MNVLLSGTLDSLGRLTARQLQLRGYRLRVLSHPQLYASEWEDLAAERLVTRDWDRATLDRVVADCEAVIHLGHRSTVETYRRRYFHAAEVDSSIQLINACRRAGVQRFVLVSSSDTVGPGTRAHPATEWNEFALFRAGSADINSKFLTESYVLEQAERGFPAVVVNPTQLLGDTDWWPLGTYRPLSRLRRYLRWVPPGGCNFVAPSDAAKGILGALERGRTGERYLLAGENLEYAQLFDLVDELTGRDPYQSVPLPRWSLLAAGQIGEVWGWIKGQRGAVNAATGRLLSSERYYDGRKAREELQMPLTPIRQAMRETIALHSRGRPVAS
jgi:dihydroflavonol-4-reductase